MSEIKYLQQQLEDNSLTKKERAHLKLELKRAHGRECFSFLPEIITELLSENKISFGGAKKVLYQGTRYHVGVTPSQHYMPQYKSYPGIYLHVSSRLPQSSYNSEILWRFERVPNDLLDEEKWKSLSAADRKKVFTLVLRKLQKRLIQEKNK